MKRSIGLLLFLVPIWVGAQQVVHHHMNITLDLDHKIILVKDKIELPISMRNQIITFYLRNDFALQAAERYKTAEPVSIASGIRLRAYTLTSVGQKLDLEYAIPLPGDQTVDPSVVALTADAFWYPQFLFDPDIYLTYQIQMNLPAEWHSVSQGSHQLVRLTQKLRQETWASEGRQEMIHLVAAKGELHRSKNLGVEIGVLLKEDNPRLAQNYLDAASDYLSLYRNLLGEYPHHKFIMLETDGESESFPGFAFVDGSTLQEEGKLAYLMAQNWFGNGVYVNPVSGNWARPLARYLSYYWAAEQNEKAHRYRFQKLRRMKELDDLGKAISINNGLRNYVQTVNHRVELFFHVLRRDMGDDQFKQTLRFMFERYKFNRVSLHGLESVVNRITRQNYHYFFRQWLDRRQLPKFSLNNVRQIYRDHQFELTFDLSQDQEDAVYRMPVPLTIVFEDQSVYHKNVLHDRRNKDVYLRFNQKPVSVLLDPLYDTPRYLYSNEASYLDVTPMTYHFAAKSVGLTDKEELKQQLPVESVLSDIPWYFSEGRMEKHWLSLQSLPIEDRINYVALHWAKLGLSYEHFGHSISAVVDPDHAGQVLVMSAKFGGEDLLSLAMMLEYAQSVVAEKWSKHILFFSSESHLGMAKQLQALSARYKIKAMINLHRLEKSAFPVYAFATGSSLQWPSIIHRVSRFSRQQIQSFENEYSMGLQRDFIANSIPALQIIAGKQAFKTSTDAELSGGAGDSPVDPVSWRKLAKMIHQLNHHLSQGQQELEPRSLAFAPYVPSQVVSNPLGLVAHHRQGNGIRVSVTPGSPASLAGLQDGDVVVQVNNNFITDLDSYANSMVKLKSGQAVAIKFLRTGKLMETNAKLVAR